MKTGSVIVLLVVGLLIWNVIGLISLGMQNESIQGNKGNVWKEVDAAADAIYFNQDVVNFAAEDRQEVINIIASGRAGYDLASENNDLNAAEAAIRQSFVDLNVIFEAYPELDLSQVYTTYQDTVNGALRRVAYERGELINAQKGYNQSRLIFFPVGLMFDRHEILGENTDPSQGVRESDKNPGSLSD